MRSLRFPGRSYLLFLLLLNLIFSACEQQPVLFTSSFTDHEGKTVQIDASKKGTVIIFLQPACPLCQSYSATIRSYIKEFGELNWVGVFPGKFNYPDSVSLYLEEYDIPFTQTVMDKDKKLVNEFSATITPEAFFLDRAGNVLYHGRIDDWAYETGKKKPEPMEHDLLAAIREFLDKGKVSVEHKPAVGCFIE